MTRLLRLGNLNLQKNQNRVSLLCTGINFTSSKSDLHANGPRHILQFLRFCTTESNGGDICENKYREAEAALLDYFYLTRSLPFEDAENMSRNAPQFLDRLLKMALINGDDGDVRRSLARFLRYHPINEFEAFFESIGLELCEYASFLPRDLIFLSDDQLLLQNYNVLCHYGIERSRIGKMYREAKEAFSYDNGILKSKLQSLQNLGLPQSLVAEIIASSPHLLKGDADQEFRVFLETFENVGIRLDWLVEHMRGVDSCDRKCMLEVMSLLGELGLRGGQLGEVIMNHPDLILEGSGSCTLCLFGLLLKFGLTENGAQAVFQQFPRVSVASFTSNLLQCYQFLVEINMPVNDIGRMVRLHPLLLGACQLKKVSSLVHLLNCGVNRICKMLEEDPYVLKKWVRGVRVDRLQEPSRVARVRGTKTRFLTRLGFVEKSGEMERIFRSLMGKADELQERFDCLVNSGLSQENVAAMLRSVPRVLNQSKDVIERKIDLFVRDLGYPVTLVVSHPILLTYTIERLKLRLVMHKWLKDEGTVKPDLSLRSLMKCPEEKFVRCYVNSHPRGTQVWERLKKDVDSLPDLT
ncbi:hypothetical protein C2S52_005125 [Perilla frutescens var. hirtella]|nr:hypothetical protein C2S51_010503 [Perilla frutescens var. frutescens]KAH6794648.1 hypothetical protein C2S52_005125 [Perilla frutescens var. hirtella]